MGVTYNPNEAIGGGPVNQSDLTTFLNLVVTIPERVVNTTQTTRKTYDSMLYGDVEKDGITYHSTKYVDISFTDFSAEGKRYKELFGVTDVDISFDTSFHPMVTVNFVDIKGASLFNPMEFNSGAGADENSRAFFSSLFHFPYPIFKLIAKGYYGPAVEYDLHVNKFDAAFDSNTGNYNVTVGFIGYMYGCLSDIPMSYVLLAPYLETGSKSSDWKYTFDDGSYMPTALEFLKKYASFKNVDEEARNNMETGISNILKVVKQNRTIKNLKTIQDSIKSIKDIIEKVKGNPLVVNDTDGIYYYNGVINDDKVYHIYHPSLNYGVGSTIEGNISNIINHMTTIYNAYSELDDDAQERLRSINAFIEGIGEYNIYEFFETYFPNIDQSHIKLNGDHVIDEGSEKEVVIMLSKYDVEHTTKSWFNEYTYMGSYAGSSATKFDRYKINLNHITLNKIYMLEGRTYFLSINEQIYNLFKGKTSIELLSGTNGYFLFSISERGNLHGESDVTTLHAYNDKIVALKRQMKNNKYVVVPQANIIPMCETIDALVRETENGVKNDSADAGLEIIKLFKKTVGFNPNIKNLNKLLFQHLEFFGDILKVNYDKCLTGQNRNINTNGVSVKVDYELKDGQNVPPFPGVAIDKKGTLERVFPQDVNYFQASPEVKFINRIYANTVRLSEKIDEISQLSGAVTGDMNALLPTDILLSDNPYYIQSNDVEKIAQHITTVLAMRVINNIKYGFKNRYVDFFEREIVNIKYALLEKKKDKVLGAIIKNLRNFESVFNKCNPSSNMMLYYYGNKIGGNYGIDGEGKKIEYTIGGKGEGITLSTPDFGYGDIQKEQILLKAYDGKIKTFLSGSDINAIYVEDAFKEEDDIFNYSKTLRNIIEFGASSLSEDYYAKKNIEKNDKKPFFKKDVWTKNEYGYNEQFYNKPIPVRELFGMIVLNTINKGMKSCLYKTKSTLDIGMEAERVCIDTDFNIFKTKLFHILKLGGHLWGREQIPSWNDASTKKLWDELINEIEHVRGLNTSLFSGVSYIGATVKNLYSYKEGGTWTWTFMGDEEWVSANEPLFRYIFLKWVNAKEDVVELVDGIKVHSLSHFYDIKEIENESGGGTGEYSISWKLEGQYPEDNALNPINKDVVLLYLFDSKIVETRKFTEIDKTTESVCNELKSIIETHMVNDTVNLDTAENASVIYGNEVKTSMYYSIKNICDKYMSLIKDVKSPIFDMGTGEVTKVKAYDSFMNDIMDTLLIDPETLNNLIYECFSQTPSLTFIQFLAKLAELNKCLFLTLPMNMDTGIDGFKKTFTPLPWGKDFTGDASIGNSYIFFKNNEDSFICESGDFVNDSLTADVNDLNSKNINAFDVAFGEQNNNYFKSISMNMDGSVQTEESIANTLMLSNAAKDGTANTYRTSMSLYDIYKERSYKVAVEMMGDMAITPFMFFNLKNIPMYRGIYRIINVRHKVTPNDFTTSFTGVKVSKYKSPENNEMGISSYIFERILNKIEEYGIEGGSDTGSSGVDNITGGGSEDGADNNGWTPKNHVATRASGFRTNNLTNMKVPPSSSSDWNGLNPDEPHKWIENTATGRAKFYNFKNPIDGMRAALINLMHKQYPLSKKQNDALDHFLSLSEIINILSPASDGNNPDTYLSSIEENTGIGRDWKYSAKNKEGLKLVFKGIIIVEQALKDRKVNGQAAYDVIRWKDPDPSRVNDTENKELSIDAIFDLAWEKYVNSSQYKRLKELTQDFEKYSKF